MAFGNNWLHLWSETERSALPSEDRSWGKRIKYIIAVNISMNLSGALMASLHL